MTVGVEVFGETAAISVKDDGVGIPRAELERLRAPIGWTGRAAETEAQASAWPLSVMAENHGGRVLVESKSGKGSTFTIELRYQPADDRVVSVLVVDDEPAFRGVCVKR